MLNTFKNYLMRTALYGISIINKIKIFLGILKQKYGILGYFECKGVPFTTFMCTKERIAACEHYDNFRPDDVLIVTYPKAGTHFTAEVIASIVKEQGKAKEGFTRASLEMAPLPFVQLKLRYKGAGVFGSLDSAKSPRIIITHLPWNLLPTSAKNGKVKIIHCLRNPKDILSSFYPFILKMRVLDPSTTWSEFVHHYVAGNVVFGSYMHFLREWYPYRNNSHVLNVTFEDMKKNLESSVKQMAAFINVELTQEQIDRVVVANTFENMKKAAGKGHVIYRKGKSGGWKSDLTVEQNEMLDEWIEREMEGLDDLQFQYS